MICVHCLEPLTHPTKDHWLPRSWYPSTTASELERWTFPSCLDCNAHYGRIENYLRSRLALALDPESEAAQGIADSVHRGMNPQLGRNDRDRAARAAKRAEIHDAQLPADIVPIESLLPGLGALEGRQEDYRVAIGVNAEKFEAFIEKLVRGLTFLQTNCVIESNYEIKMHLFSPEDTINPLEEMLGRFGKTIDRRPGIHVIVARDQSDPVVSICKFKIWERLEIYSSVLPQEDALQAST